MRPARMHADRGVDSLMGLLAEQALSRTAGAALVRGNGVRLLKDAAQNYPAWLEAIAGARYAVNFENYLISNDAVGQAFADALAERARAGVRVRVIHDWMGGLGVWSGRLLARVAAAGGEVRRFNPPRFGGPFGWLTRDHRKMLAVDGEIGFVSGLCVSEKWAGDRRRGREPWRDTGIEIRGPAVADIDRAFADLWAEMGPPIPREELEHGSRVQPAGDVALRVLATVPNAASVYRLDQLIASLARETLWLTDAYFVGVPPYVQALRAAAADGVDVRLLVPGTSDLPVVSSFSRSGYRPLLEAGVRVFEWNGAMLHAKTAVADGHWARVGSSNLNLASWIGNYELDVAIEDHDFAHAMERMYEEDLGNATEIVLAGRSRVRAAQARRRRRPPRAGSKGASAGRAAAGALRIGNTVSAAITNRRILGPAEAGLMLGMGLVVITLSVLAMLWPAVIMLPLAALGIWVGISFLIRGARLRASSAEDAAPPAVKAPSGQDNSKAG